jgi:hypothetical protein
MRTLPILFIAALPMFAGGDDRPGFSGTWHVDTASCELHSRISPALTWKIDQKDEDIHFVESASDKGSLIDVTCGTRGADCKTKEAGKPVTVSFWYNGPALVEMETEGKGVAVTKRKIQLSSDGSSLIVEVTHILPEGRTPEKIVLKKEH